MTRIAIVLGSTRPGRLGKAVAEWVLQRSAERTDAQFELLDVADFDLPLLDEPLPPSLGRHEHGHTRAWAEAVAGFDGFVFVTGEYNHSVPGALKNALDYLYAEWNNKAAAFVSYGSAGRHPRRGAPAGRGGRAANGRCPRPGCVAAVHGI